MIKPRAGLFDAQSGSRPWRWTLLTSTASLATAAPTATELLFITLSKSEGLVPPPATRTRDLAIGPSLFHWESQPTTAASSPIGQRFIHNAARGSRLLRSRG